MLWEFDRSPYMGNMDTATDSEGLLAEKEAENHRRKVAFFVLD